MGIDGAMIDLFLKGSAFVVQTLGRFLGIFPRRLRYLSKKLFLVKTVIMKSTVSPPSVRFKMKLIKVIYNCKKN